MPFIIIFIVIPLVELSVFAALSDYIGLGTALLLALFTAIIGGVLVRQQGLQTLLSIRLSMERGRMPLSELFDGICLVAAGALLITPGFVTDTIGFALLFPAMRNILRHVIKKHTNWAVHTEKPHEPTAGSVIEGEYERYDED